MRSQQAAAIAAALLLGLSSFAMAAESSTAGNTTGTTTAPSTATGMTPGRSTSGPGTSANAGTSGTSSAMMSEAQVKQKLEKQGYTNVTGLKEGKDGTWMGKAMHNGAEVTVDVDQTGQVTTK